jgi:(E)-4-hydroxy-3-methylbut-2-enyl-diphosphate synthase
MAYCASRRRTIRRPTVEVRVGAVGVGGDNPIRLQSMTTADTQDVDATVRECIALAEAGCEIVRVTAPNVAAAECLKAIRQRFSAAGFAAVPLVADIHFLPSAAMVAVEHVEKVRVNPGNYADKKKFAVREYSDQDYDRELQRLHEAFAPLVRRCRELGRAVRIGTNHGSLSDRIMNRYGDTPLGMVESALEFVRIAEAEGLHDLILSMKASNPKVMIQAYRLLVDRMDAHHRPYPLHLGVTEAGDGEDGRIKSAIGIGALLLDGIGDTIRVSLTEDSVYELPVARAIADKAMSQWRGAEPDAACSGNAPDDPVDPFHFNRRATAMLPLSSRCLAGPGQPPRVIVRIADPAQLARLATAPLADTPAEGALVPVPDAGALSKIRQALATGGHVDFLVLELGATVKTDELEDFARDCTVGLVLCRRFGGADGETLAAFVQFVRRHQLYLAVRTTPGDLDDLEHALRMLGGDRLIFTLAEADGLRPHVGHALGLYRTLAAALDRLALGAPLWIRNTAATAVCHDPTFLGRLIEASFLTGGLLCDGLGDLVSFETELDPVRATKLTYNVLQGAGARLSKTEFVACPSCGRTLFDLQATTRRIRGQTGHLKGVKIAIMGCIVNGPGEMADADFGYVGGAPGKINLYVGRTCVQYNVPQSEADQRLVALIKEHGKWVDPVMSVEA